MKQIRELCFGGDAQVVKGVFLLGALVAPNERHVWRSRGDETNGVTYSTNKATCIKRTAYYYIIYESNDILPQGQHRAAFLLWCSWLLDISIENDNLRQPFGIACCCFLASGLSAESVTVDNFGQHGGILRD